MAKQNPIAVRFTDTKRVKELIALMAANDLTELELVEDKSKITLRRGTVAVVAAAAPSHHGVAATAGTAAPVPVPEAEENLLPIKSPMVGTFYSAANPESGPFVSAGTQVREDTVVCIIEAMKVFNEIRAEVSGTVVKVLIQNGQSVEFGQPMYLVEPN